MDSRLERRNSEPFVEQSYTIYNPEYGNQILAKLNILRQEMLFTDALLCVGDKQFPCHRNVLAVSSVYFTAMFSSNLRESRECKVTLKGISPATVQCMLDYIYTGHIEITIDNAQELLATGSQYAYPVLVDACCDFLTKHLHVSNCLGIKNFAHLHSCSVLQEKAHAYVLENFSAVVEQEEFLAMSLQDLIEYISSDHIDVQKEETVYVAVMKWVHHDVINRQRHLCQVIEYVRLPIIDEVYLESVVSKDLLILNDQECLQMVEEAKKYHETKTDQHGQRRVSMQDRSVLPRPSTMAKEVIVMVGGVSGFSVSSVDMYEPQKDKWFPLPDLHATITDYSIATIGNNIYVCGGLVKSVPTNQVWKFDTAKRKWSLAPSMVKCRAGHASTSLNDRIFLLGGYSIENGKSITTEHIESFDAVSNEWSIVGNCPFPRTHSQLVPYENSLIEIGGKQGDVRVYTIERYLCDGTHLKYSGEQFVLPNVIEYAKIVILDDIFYIIWEDTRKMIRLDPELRKFRFLAEMKYSHINSGATVIGNNIYIIGGLVDEHPSRVVECYDPIANKWTIVKSLVAPRAGHGCVTVQM